MIELRDSPKAPRAAASDPVVDQLRSLQFRDRAVEVETAGRRPGQSWLLVAAGTLLGALLAAGAFLLWGPTAPSPAPAPADQAVRNVPALGDQTSIAASGYIVARRRATIASEVTGRLVRLGVQEGERVRRGQMLAELDNATVSADVANAEAALRSAQAELRGRQSQLSERKRELARVETLLARGFSTESQMTARRSEVEIAESALAASYSAAAGQAAALRRARSSLSKYRIVAPFDGLVVSTNAQVGEIISPVSAGGGFTRTGICTIVDPNSLEIEVEVNEALISKIVVGQSVVAALDAYPENKMPARVIAIIPSANREKSSVRVRIGLLASDPNVLPDMAVKVAFKVGGKTAS